MIRHRVLGGKIMKFEGLIREIVEENCEDYFLGAVDLSHENNELIKRFQPLLEEYPRAISIGIT